MHAFLVTGSNNQARLKNALGISKLPLNHPDLLLVEPEKTSVTIKQIKDLKSWLHKKPFQAPQKAAIVSKSHLMSHPAQNALLKSLEEPPEHTIIILTAPNPENLLPTTISRCQVISLASTLSSKTDLKEEFNKITTSSLAEKISLSKQYSSSKDNALAFCTNLLQTLRNLIRQNPQKYGSALTKTHIAIKRLKGNLNPRLTLEHLFISLDS